MAPWTIAHQAPLFMGLSRQHYCNGLPFSSPRDLPNPEIEHTSLALAGGFFTTEPLRKPLVETSSLLWVLSNSPFQALCTWSVLLSPRTSTAPKWLSLEEPPAWTTCCTRTCLPPELWNICHCSKYPLSARSFISPIFLVLSAMGLFRILGSRNQVPLPPECPCTSVARLPQQSTTGWLKITDIYSFTVLEVRSPKSKCRQGHIPSETCRGESFLASGGLLALLGISCLQPFNLCLYHQTVLLSSVSVSLLSFL